MELHRAALGWDLLRAPANVVLAPVFLASRMGAFAAARLGADGVARWLGSRRVLLRTDVSRAVERAVVTELLELPWPVDGGRLTRDALAEAILHEPAVRDALGDGPGVRIGATLDEYLGARSAVAEMTAALAALGAGAAAFQQITPGMISLGPVAAAAAAQDAAVAAFPLGAWAGSAWHALFPASASLAMVTGATAAMAAAGALLAAFAGVIADPAQLALGVHRRRLLRMIDAMERAFLAEHGPGFTAREHYFARIADLADAAVAALRAVRGG